MSQPSSWPLPSAGIRLLTPAQHLSSLREHPLSRACYPTAIGYYPQAAGHNMRRERHDDYLLIFCTQGHGTLETRGAGHLVGAGDVALIARGEAHSYRAADNDPWTIYWAHFAGEDAPALVHFLLRGTGPLLRCGAEPRLVGSFRSLLEAATGAYRLDTWIHISSTLRQLLTQFALYRGRRPGRRLGSVDVSAVESYMAQHLGSTLRLDDLATVAGLSRQHFVKRYREQTGTTPLTHFQQMKIEAACRLLDATDDSVKVIAASLGFTDPLYFSRVFRRVQGMSPMAYRVSQRR